MAQGWDFDPSVFMGIVEEKVGLKIRAIAIQILNVIVETSPVESGWVKIFIRFLPALECGCQRTLANYGERLFVERADLMGFWRTTTEGGELMNGVPCRNRTCN